MPGARAAVHGKQTGPCSRTVNWSNQNCSKAGEGRQRAATAARSVLPRRRAEQDPLDLDGGSSAEAQRGLEALGAGPAGVGGAPQLVQRRVVLLADLVAACLQQDQVAGGALARGQAAPRAAAATRRP